MLTLRVADDASPVRLDAYLASHAEGYARRSAQRVIADGAVRVNGRWARKSQVVGPGDVIEVPPVPVPVPAPNARLAIPIAYEDQHLVVLEKPPGLPCVALHAGERDTLASFLLARYPETATASPRPLESGLVHRLDNDTSGLVVAARTSQAYANLREQFELRAVVKEYVALVEGAVQHEGVIDLPLAHDRRHPERMKVAGPGHPEALPARTTYRPVQQIRKHTLVAVRIATGVRHQIRLHFASMGHAVVGDRLYGAKTPAPRHLLHACYLAFRHPDSGIELEVRSALPQDFIEAMNRVNRPRRPQGRR